MAHAAGNDQTPPAGAATALLQEIARSPERYPSLGVDDAHRLAVECRQDVELIMADNASKHFHTVPQVIAFPSGYMTLYPGDIIAMG